MFYNFRKISLGITNNSSISFRVLNHSRNHSGTVILLAVFFNQLFQGFSLNQWCISIKNQNILILFKKTPSHFHRMTCPFLLGLQGKYHAFLLNGGLYFFCLMSHNNANLLSAATLCRIYYIINHWFIQNFMQHLWFFGPHASAFSCCQNNSLQIFHRILLSHGFCP